jgi:hypothetical protein|tara:strand:+ start:6681 stop:6875 length:195 start_codon:yes stop_codon:yes gene_type:complete
MGDKTTRSNKTPKSLLPRKENITKIDPESRKRSMTNIRINMINKMINSFLKNIKPEAKKQKSKK